MPQNLEVPLNPFNSHKVFCTFFGRDISYQALEGTEFYTLTERSIVNYIATEQTKPPIVSARLSTGLFGMPDCPTGNKGPLDQNEVVIGIGEEGIQEIVRLGFIPHWRCNPVSRIDNFWQIAGYTAKEKYHLKYLRNFEKLKYDTRRVNFEKLVPLVRGFPRHIILPPSLTRKEIDDFRHRLQLIARNISISVLWPKLGYYNEEGKFTDYNVTFI